MSTVNCWVSSGPKSPCPLCGRPTDGKCRRSTYRIHCWFGDRFHPPSGLIPGHTLQLEGQTWAVVSLQGGFGGNSLVLAPHLDRQSFAPRQRQQRQRQAASVAPVLADLFRRVRCYVHASLAVRDSEESTLAEFHRDLGIVATTARHLQDLRIEVHAARRETPDLNRLLVPLTLWERRIGYQLRDLQAFDHHYLGTPTARQIEALQREVA